MKGPNLNPWWRVWYREANQWLRRQYMKCDKARFQQLIDRKREVASREVLTDVDQVELAYLNWQLGSGAVYWFTSEQEEMLRKLTRAIIVALKEESNSHA